MAYYNYHQSYERRHSSSVKGGIIGSILVLVVGVVFAFIGYYVYNNVEKNKEYYRETIGVIEEIVVDIDEVKVEHDDGTVTYEEKIDHTVYVSYDVDGVHYSRVKYNSYNTSMYEGQEVEVVYDMRDPGEVVGSVASQKIGSYICFGVGGICVVLSIGLAIGSIVKKSKLEY